MKEIHPIGPILPEKKILVADPARKSRESLSGFLRKKGAEVIEASDGNEALSGSLQALPDLLVLDLSVGVLPPERLVGILHANPKTKSIPILFLGSKVEGIQGFRPGIDLFLKRPFHEEDLFRRIRGIIFRDPPPQKPLGNAGMRTVSPADSELISSDDFARLRTRMKERGLSGIWREGRIVFFLPGESCLESVVGALGGSIEFVPEPTFFAIRRKEGLPVGAFGRISKGPEGEETSLVLYAFPCLTYASPLWYAIASRPLGIVAFLEDDAAGSLEKLTAVTEYARGARAGAVLAIMMKHDSGFGLGKNTLRLFRNKLEKLRFSFRVNDVEELSPEAIRSAVRSVVRQYIEEG